MGSPDAVDLGPACRRATQALKITYGEPDLSGDGFADLIADLGHQWDRLSAADPDQVPYGFAGIIRRGWSTYLEESGQPETPAP